ncbi:hypothetical protein ACFQPF_05415 [Fictibacillus iocasae]|uniref:Uncharacterized protein n=1 Tax=Fictibacillus iocasae TaxID=2715437 RepID=A0ABW2NPK1_9BACL
MFELLDTKKAGAISKLNKVSAIIPAADVLSFVEKLAEAYKEHKMTERELARIEATRDILMTEMAKKYELYHKVFDQIFEERRIAVGKTFAIIDKGLADGNKELVSMGLNSLSTIVSTSPFADFKQLSGLLEGGGVIEI